MPFVKLDGDYRSLDSLKNMSPAALAHIRRRAAATFKGIDMDKAKGHIAKQRQAATKKAAEDLASVDVKTAANAIASVDAAATAKAAASVDAAAVAEAVAAVDAAATAKAAAAVDPVATAEAAAAVDPEATVRALYEVMGLSAEQAESELARLKKLAKKT